MKNRIFYLVLLIVGFFIPQLNAQGEILGTSRFARAIRLGNAYTGVADGPEAMFYNSAGLAFNDYYSFVFSSGQGYAIFLEDIDAFDYGLTLPISKDIGSIGFSVYTNNYEFYRGDPFNLKTDNSIRQYSVYYARSITDNLALGISGNFYSDDFKTTYLSEQETNRNTASAFDLGISALFSVNKGLITDMDRLQIGIQLHNILNHKLYFDTYGKVNLVQHIRYGFSYLYNPDSDGIRFFKVLFAFDLVTSGGDYTYRYWYPNFGIELTLMDIVHLSYGRENENVIKKEYFSSSPQYPVNRFGIGADLNVNEAINLGPEIIIKLDYCYSFWEKIDEDSATLFIDDNKPIELDRDAFSISLNVRI